MRLITKFLTSVSLLGISATSFAENSIGGAASNLMGPIGALTDLVLFACYIVGAALIIGAIMQYRIHRQNAKQVPLTTPIFYLIMGVLLLFLPYFSTIAKTWSVAKKTGDQSSYEDPTQQQAEPTAEDSSTGSGFWGAPPAPASNAGDTAAPTTGGASQ